MADFIEPGPVSDTAGIREAVCIHTRKIFDSCREKDIAPLRILRSTPRRPRGVKISAGIPVQIRRVLSFLPCGR